MGAAITGNPLEWAECVGDGGFGRDVPVSLGSLNARLVLVGHNEDSLRQTLAMMWPDDHRVEPFNLTAVVQIPDWLRRVTADAGPSHGLVHAAGKQLTAPVQLGFGTPRDVSYAVAFLLADTPRWVIGSTLVGDGGYSIQ